MTNNTLFDQEDPFGLPPAPEKTKPNAPPEYTVSELSHKLKRVIEDGFSFVRVRGEVSKVTVAKSGHLYTALKDDAAVLDAICWKGTVGSLGLKPEEGMEVVCTGRLTTYPGRSNYQLIIETMELAGQGALLKMLEERKKKLAAEGLFDPARKKPIPFLPNVIGVITSPTGAVIRDIMHRLDERFPRRVLLWPVMVQGQGAAAQVAAAIAGFNAIPKDSQLRPDVLIVARGGGSLEDLMPFNDEIVVRAAAASKIPLISAVGHETDTTLIDYASDLRAPTPTAAAEKAVPVRAEIRAWVLECQKRMFVSAQRLMQQHQTHLQGLGRGLGDPKRLLEHSMQKLDSLSGRLDMGLQSWLDRRTAQVNQLAAKISLSALRQKIGDAERHIRNFAERLVNTEGKILKDRQQKLANLSALLESLSFKGVLARGYSVVKDAKGNIVSSVKQAVAEKDVLIVFHDGEAEATVKKQV
ncbi:MAG: exodeoxyribonuclease VII large subunit [Alphaproteobacteria bacterium]|nr:MAG: exodeoxyribonuclease VII large subunit [Alphaproteobacteria bacterium]